MQPAIESANLREAEGETERDQLETAAEEEVARLESQLALVKARSDALVQKHEAELQQLRKKEEERKKTEKSTALKAKQVATKEWQAKMESIEAHYQRKLQQVNDEAVNLQSHLETAASKAVELAADRKHSAEVEFESFKAMTRRIISQKDEELERRRLVEESAVRIAEKEAAMLQSVQRRMEARGNASLPLEMKDTNLVALVVGVVVLIVLYILYNIYQSTGSFVCFLDALGLKIGKGCMQTSSG